ncbi:PA14 domain-containing protein [Ferruginibacter sp. HRS2-29]|uniref:PA14 domain-containing protein n=1 Tax=Ferruginibacter sp. HRS2-29 TaxID=2487334 RepID=UPI0020CD2AA8|nr:PA14 domain-containing protein [Ferruginibacter sp. HRS2-29]MCP9752453.1 hypothetical protein [Ferruginibacter sp. HRS2-29]
MLYSFATRFQKPIAWTFFLIFYAELAAGALVRPVYDARSGNYTGSRNTGIKKQYFNNPVQNIASVPATSHTTVADVDPASSVVKVMSLANDSNVQPGSMDDGPGPSQPEMQSFKSIGTDNMVDLFSGDFSYNIPLLDVGGYPISIHYNSGVTMDQESSWVGLGWNINPGTINRNVRGLPDDFDGTDTIIKVMNMKPNKTIGGSVSKTWELFAKKVDKKVNVGLGGKFGVFHNNYKGWGVEYGINSSMSTGLFSRGQFTAGLSIGNNNQTGLDVSPSFGVSVRSKGEKAIGLSTNIGSNYNSRTGISALQITGGVNFSRQATYDGQSGRGQVGVHFPAGSITFSKPAFTPTINMPYTSESYSYSLSPGRYRKFQLKTWATISAYTSKNYIAPEDTVQVLKAYGYNHYQDAADAGDRVLLDFNRDKEVPYRANTPNIAVPSYTYDLYSISGEGIGGSFRPYRGDIGFVFDHTSRTKSKSGNFSLEAGYGTWAEIGVDIEKTTNQTVTGPWKTGNNLLASQIKFRQEDNTLAEPVFFRNPGEKVKADYNYLQAVGDTDLVSIALTGISSNNASDPVLNSALNKYKNHIPAGTVPLSLNNSYRKERSKRTQVITYLNADLASHFALDTVIKTYDINTIPSLGCNSNYQVIKRSEGYRKPNHLSEISVLNTDGRRYIYGVPAYNTTQREVSFAVNKNNGDINTGLVTYTPGDNTTANAVDGTDQFYNKEITPSYVHSFMLSSILSADYVDLTGNGITEDDQGDAVRFNYTRVYGGSGNIFKWRAPYQANTAAYNEGLKSDKRDDRGSYTYGEKEVWYLNSLESKNMIAAFVLETDPAKVRKDAFGTNGENGGKDASQKVYQLKEINLYSKADLIKYGQANAKPIKTVHFEYDYSLCKDHPGAQSTGIGKLTLRKIWFTYNKNDKGVQNPYIFHYDKDTFDGSGNLTGNNSPAYNNKSYDRWGNYKDASANQTSIPNADFPYASQNATTANTNAAAWSLNEILLPSGGKMKITYEADDYGYVQNLRAMQMMEVAGFGKLSTDAPQNQLYTKNSTGLINQISCDYIFIKVPDQVNTNAELYRKYLEGVKKMFVKFSMNVKTDVWGGGSENVPCYFDIESYGIKGSPSDKIIWIKPKAVDGKNAFLLAATQFLRMNLYSKAYPYSEPGDNLSAGEFFKAIGTVAGNIKNATAGFYDYTISEGRCKEINSTKSYARLNNPFYKKYGGGHRVKKVEIFDNWKVMAGVANNLTESTYGQQYDYTTVIKNESGNDITISSGVASYEPMIGRDENPFTVPSDPYKEQVGLLAPTDYFYVDEPVMESFYPSAGVGYSKVRVSSIHTQNKSANGVSETEFFTSKDFPVQSGNTQLVEGQSRYTYQNPATNKLNFFNYNPRSYVTLSQGFKVELNDMNGKVKRTASYAQNDLKNPISYSINYYRLENDRLANRLSSKVDMVDSANGIISKDAEMGKEVELMVDLREQLSVTTNSSKQLNVLVQKVNSVPGFFILPIPLMYRKSEINRYRSAAVTKVITRYGIIDSVVVMDKGSKVTTRNLVYDSETGEPVLTRTNNEFDDPIYNFSYPAHWAYSGMASAYKNVQKTFTGQQITYGVLRDRSFEKYFESGDEIILTERAPVKNTLGVILTGQYTYSRRKIWAIDASKGIEQHTGIYFIDANGAPVTTINNINSSLLIIRSGKRNLTSVGAGSITAMADPVKLVSGNYKIVFDTGSHVIAAAAARFKDMWRVDSTVSLVDTCYKVIDSARAVLPMKRASLLKKWTIGPDDNRPSVYMPTNIAAGMHQIARRSRLHVLTIHSILDFDMTAIPAGATITNASLHMSPMPLRDTTNGLTSPENWIYNNGVDPVGGNNTYSNYNVGGQPHVNGNALNFSRVLTNWSPATMLRDVISLPPNDPSSVTVGSTATGQNCDNINIPAAQFKNLVQSLSDNRATSFGILMKLTNSDVNSSRVSERRMQSFNSGYHGQLSSGINNCYNSKEGGFGPLLIVDYKFIKDTCVLTCKPSIRPEAINPYRFGVLGNWQMDRAYTYYDARKESDATTETNIRRDGEIKDFQPYWQFSTGTLKNNNADTTVRWVWNSQLELINRKGAELENKDPLNRYNSVQYGYNKQLPVAVAQNSKSRNMVFDGFEDYEYKTSYCEAECQYTQCLPVVYDPKLNNCDTLSNAFSAFSGTYNVSAIPPAYNSAGCDTTTWGFPQCPVGYGQAYTFQSMFANGQVAYPDSGVNFQQFQLQYKRTICIATPAATYEARFKALPITGRTPLHVFFTLLLTGGRSLDVRVGIGGVGGLAGTSGYGFTSRPDLNFNFLSGFNTLKVVMTATDTVEVYVNNTLLGKVGMAAPGIALYRGLSVPTLQFNECTARIDWVKYYDGNGRLVFDEQFNSGCSTFALPKPEFDCSAPKPECGMAFADYFNNRFKTNFTLAQVGSLYKQCGIYIGPCGDSLPSCTSFDTSIVKAAGFDRFVDFTRGGGVRTTAQKHTGKYSIKVAANATAGNTVKLVTPLADAGSQSISIKIDTVNAGYNVVTPKGTGLLTRYNVFRADPLFINTCMRAFIATPIWNLNTQYGNINKDWGVGAPRDLDPLQYCATDYFGVEWTGKLQPEYTAKYMFRLQKGADDVAQLYINNAAVNFTFSNNEWKTDSISLSSCVLYNIKLVYTEFTKDAKCRLLWSNPFEPEATVIPVRNFYSPTMSASDSAGSCMPVGKYPKMNPVKPSNMINPLFSPIAGTQMVVGAWVRESNTCYTGSYSKSGIDVSFGNSSTFFRLRPSGNIIEGWQRIEGVITIPSGATSMNIGLRSLGSTDVYFDDIRLHPFNATMKSFVYNPSNLRLMAELDENNYSSFYEYDDDGTLIRVKKETERGIKTIQETRSALIKEP